MRHLLETRFMSRGFLPTARGRMGTVHALGDSLGTVPKPQPLVTKLYLVMHVSWQLGCRLLLLLVPEYPRGLSQGEERAAWTVPLPIKRKQSFQRQWRYQVKLGNEKEYPRGLSQGEERAAWTVPLPIKRKQSFQRQWRYQVKLGNDKEEPRGLSQGEERAAWTVPVPRDLLPGLPFVRSLWFSRLCGSPLREAMP